MPQQQSPWLETAYGWAYGENGWNTGMDSNLLKFSVMFDRNIDSIVASLPPAVNGQVHYNTTDNRIYFAVNTSYFSTPVPKWFTVVVRSTGATWQFNGTSLVEVESVGSLDTRLDAVELTLSSLGSAAFEDVSFFATQANLDIVSAQANNYTDEKLSELGIISVSLFGAVGDGVADDTAAFQALADQGGAGFIPEGTYMVGSISVNKSITWSGAGDKTIIKRKAGVDTNSPSSPTSALIKFTSHNSTYTFRDILFDGNETAQIPYEPYGYIASLSNVPGGATSRLAIIFDNCTFKDATQACIRMDGDTATAGYEELTVTNCRFVDGRVGLAQGNPNVTSPSGYGPDYITLTDKVYANIIGNSFVFNKTLNPGEFSRTAVRITFSTNTDNADGSRANISDNYFYRCGRGERNGPQRPGNDVGVIDAYARGRELRITNNLFESSEGAPIRGKTNCDLVYIAGNISDSSSRNPAINIGPNSYAQQTGRIVITNNLIRQASGYGIGVVGNAGVVGGDDDVNNGENTQDYVADVLILGNVVEGVNSWTMQGFAAATGDGILVRNFKNVIVSNNLLGGIAGTGLLFRGQADTEEPNSAHLSVIGNRVEAAGGGSYRLLDGFSGTAIFEGNASRDTTGVAYLLQATSGVGANLIFNGNSGDNSVDYGVITRYWNSVVANGNQMTGVSGLSRGFYFQDMVGTAKLTGNHTNATTPLFGVGSHETQDFANTWNPRVQFRSSIPTTGTWARGDIVYNTAPTAAGFIGWVCVTAGTPGTWKTFGTITA